MHNGSTIRLRFVRDAGFSPDGITEVRCEKGEIRNVPNGVARSLVVGGIAAPVDPDAPGDLPPFGGQGGQRADAVLRKHDLAVTEVAGDENVRRLEEKHRDLTARLDDALGRLHAAERDAAQLEHERREAKVQALTGEGDGEAPDPADVEAAEDAVEDARERVAVLRDALDRIGDRLVQALDEAHERADADVQEAHRALLRKALDAARKFNARLDDLETFEGAHNARIDGPTVGGVDGIERWIDNAAERK